MDKLVSIICNTHNDENYIKTTIESFLMQKTSFPFEILIHDDCSSDNTPKIIKEYEKKYPNLIFPIYQKDNRYSKYEDITIKYQIPRARGKYIAICQGDDFWIDENKLEKQLNFLENHKEYNACTSACICIDANTLYFKYFIAPSDKDKVLTVKDVILGDGGFVGTNTLFFRKDTLNNYPEYGTPNHIDDYQLQLHLSRPNGIYYMADCMSAYRFKSDDSWSTVYANNENDITEAKCKILDIFNNYTNGEYKEIIGKKMKKDEDDSSFNKFIKNLKYHFISKEYNKHIDQYYNVIDKLNNR